SWDGKLLACQLMEAPWTLPLEEGFQSAWERYPTLIKPVERSEECLGCKQLSTCWSCHATRLAESGDAGIGSPYLCESMRVMPEHKQL
ncbi:MAG: hypothetical protein GX650_07105, partial [Clostridiales bacterium]|nr:hypothetical protein [Clostridiales bacterium]